MIGQRRGRRVRVARLGLAALLWLTCVVSADAQQAPTPTPTPRRRPTRTVPPKKAGPTLPKDTTKTPVDSARVPDVPKPTPAPSAPASRDTTRPMPSPRDTARAASPVDVVPTPGAATPTVVADPPIGAAPGAAAPTRDSLRVQPDSAGTATRAARVPRGAWRVGAGLLDAFNVLVPVRDGTNPDVRLGAVPMVALEGEFRVAGPFRLYATAAGGRGTIGHSGALDLSGRPVSAAYPVRLALGTAGLLLQPTFGGAVLQPYIRGGGGIRAALVDLPSGRVTAADPAVEGGGGFRIHGGRVGGFVEARWVRSLFKSSTLPMPLVPPTETAQDDLLVLVGVRVTR